MGTCRVFVVAAGALVQTQVEDVARVFLIDEHVVAIVDGKGVENEAQLLDTFRSAQFTRSSLQTRVQRKVSLPHLLTFKCPG